VSLNLPKTGQEKNLNDFFQKVIEFLKNLTWVFQKTHVRFFRKSMRFFRKSMSFCSIPSRTSTSEKETRAFLLSTGACTIVCRLRPTDCKGCARPEREYGRSAHLNYIYIGRCFAFRQAETDDIYFICFRKPKPLSKQWKNWQKISIRTSDTWKNISRNALPFREIYLLLQRSLSARQTAAARKAWRCRATSDSRTWLDKQLEQVVLRLVNWNLRNFISVQDGLSRVPRDSVGLLYLESFTLRFSQDLN